MHVLGLDPGLVRTGWAVLEPGRGRAALLGHGTICPPPEAALPARLAYGARELRGVLAVWQPQLVALEEVFTAPRHPRSALLMAHMRGVLCLVLEEAGLPIVPLTATTVKQRLTGAGHASKQQVQRMTMRLIGLDPATTAGMRLDETDAIALALTALHETPAGGVTRAPLARQGHGAAQREARLRELAQRAQPGRGRV